MRWLTPPPPPDAPTAFQRALQKVERHGTRYDRSRRTDDACGMDKFDPGENGTSGKEPRERRSGLCSVTCSVSYRQAEVKITRPAEYYPRKRQWRGATDSDLFGPDKLSTRLFLRRFADLIARLALHSAIASQTPQITHHGVMGSSEFNTNA